MGNNGQVYYILEQIARQEVVRLKPILVPFAACLLRAVGPLSVVLADGIEICLLVVVILVMNEKLKRAGWCLFD